MTDNGAGGLSSSVGEMAQGTNGAKIDVGLAPVKYLGLAPYELWVSESQERMTFAVPPEKIQAFLDLAKRRQVEATDMGEFTDDGKIQISYKGRLVGMLHLDFLHDGLPPMVLKAKWKGPQAELSTWGKNPEKIAAIIGGVTMFYIGWRLSPTHALIFGALGAAGGSGVARTIAARMGFLII